MMNESKENRFQEVSGLILLQALIKYLSIIRQVLENILEEKKRIGSRFAHS